MIKYVFPKSKGPHASCDWTTTDIIPAANETTHPDLEAW